MGYICNLKLCFNQICVTMNDHFLENVLCWVNDTTCRTITSDIMHHLKRKCEISVFYLLSCLKESHFTHTDFYIKQNKLAVIILFLYFVINDFATSQEILKWN